ncbi:FeoB-associated Cys-rich membrane protein [uncultured Polaribacter sp.]|nr:FeoB-associated Cys-rich membrane protein [uncultured Polaribacter sp.]
MQQIIVYILVLVAVFFLLKKYILPSKKKTGCSTDCNCH